MKKKNTLYIWVLAVFAIANVFNHAETAWALVSGTHHNNQNVDFECSAGGIEAVYGWRQSDTTTAIFAQHCTGSWVGTAWSDHLSNDSYYFVETNTDDACDGTTYALCKLNIHYVADTSVVIDDAGFIGSVASSSLDIVESTGVFFSLVLFCMGMWFSSYILSR